MLPDQLLSEVARRFALLGDETRLRVVRHLHDHGESSVGEIADGIGATVANVSQHLHRLLVGGVVTRRRERRSVLYAIDDPTVEALCSTACDSVRDRTHVMHVREA